MSAADLAKHGTEIGSNRKIAAFEQALLFQPRPLAMNLSALNRPPSTIIMLPCP
jgi:hypothetical protein